MNDELKTVKNKKIKTEKINKNSNRNRPNIIISYMKTKFEQNKNVEHLN